MESVQATRLRKGMLIKMKGRGDYIEELFTTHIPYTEKSLITRDEIVKNKDLFLLEGKIYDFTDFKHVHPGGEKVFLGHRDIFTFVHGKDQRILNAMKTYYVGDLTEIKFL